VRRRELYTRGRLAGRRTAPRGVGENCGESLWLPRSEAASAMAAKGAAT
jgi:hypothetical protein